MHPDYAHKYINMAAHPTKGRKDHIDVELLPPTPNRKAYMSNPANTSLDGSTLVNPSTEASSAPPAAEWDPTTSAATAESLRNLPSGGLSSITGHSLPAYAGPAPHGGSSDNSDNSWVIATFNSLHSTFSTEINHVRQDVASLRGQVTGHTKHIEDHNVVVLIRLTGLQQEVEKVRVKFTEDGNSV